jgi:hypothetical protein
MTDKVVIENVASYAPCDKPTPYKQFKLEVDCILDMVPGAFSSPEDLMNWIATNPYVRKVTMVEEPVRK